MPDLIRSGGDVSLLAQNYRRAFDGSNFGTRKLAFYMVNLPHEYGLTENWQENNSLYTRIVRAIQSGGNGTYPNPFVPAGKSAAAEIFWLGQPNYVNTFGYDDCFTFAIADDAESPREVAIDGGPITATATDAATGRVTVDSTSNVYDYNSYVTFTGSLGGIVAGQKYYVNDTGSDWIRLSLERGGEIITLEDATGSINGTVVVFDTSWQGTAGDIQFACCGGPGGNGAYQTVASFNFISALYDIIENTDGWVERLDDSSVIAPRWLQLI
jgi:hypothetical protein